MDILVNVILPIFAIDAIAREALGNDISGVSVGSTTRIHLLSDSPSNQNVASALLNNFGNLSVNADKTVMNEGDADPVIICNDADIATDTEVSYLVLLDGEGFAEGIAPVTLGEVTLNLVAPLAGIYDIYIYRKRGNYASGSITIIVNEV